MNILLVHQTHDSFVEKDMNILKERHNVKEFYFRGLKDMVGLYMALRWADVAFCWFGKLQAFFAVLFSKFLDRKSIVIAGGDDVAYVPEIGYGMFSYWYKKFCPLFVFRYADIIIPVSRYNAGEALHNAKANPKKIRVISHGFEGDKFKRSSEVKKENAVITIGEISKETTIKKGLKLFVDAARYLPDIEFQLIGPDADGTVAELKKSASGNVVFTGGLYGQDLIDLCSRAKVYVQVSVHESFGGSLAEAMLCECIPVVSRNAAIPEVAGEAGIYVEELTPENVAEKIKYALTLPEEYGAKARARIVEKFPLNKRRRQMLEVIEELRNA